MNREEYLIQPLVFPNMAVYDWPPIKFSISDLPKNTLGVCYARAASAADQNEIFITAFSSDTDKLLKVLVHEICHAILDNRGGHGPEFKKVASQAGLRAPYASAKNGEISTSTELDESIAAIVEALGPIPHSELKKPEPQKGRNNHKLVCGSCKWQANTSKKHIVDCDGFKIQGAKCPSCGSYQVDAV